MDPLRNRAMKEYNDLIKNKKDQNTKRNEKQYKRNNKE